MTPVQSILLTICTCVIVMCDTVHKIYIMIYYVISVFHLLVHCIISTLHVIMLSL